MTEQINSLQQLLNNVIPVAGLEMANAILALNAQVITQEAFDAKIVKFKEIATAYYTPVIPEAEPEDTALTSAFFEGKVLEGFEFVVKENWVSVLKNGELSFRIDVNINTEEEFNKLIQNA
jgi:hypothetical protein